MENLTKDAQCLAGIVYREFLIRLENGADKDDATQFYWKDLRLLYPEISDNDLRTTIDEFCSAFKISPDMSSSFEINAGFISYMEGRFKRNVLAVADFVSKFI